MHIIVHVYITLVWQVIAKVSLSLSAVISLLGYCSIETAITPVLYYLFT